MLIGSIEADHQSLLAGLAADLSTLYPPHIACRC